jgi:hypothetical protein
MDMRMYGMIALVLIVASGGSALFVLPFALLAGLVGLIATWVWGLIESERPQSPAKRPPGDG